MCLAIPMRVVEVDGLSARCAAKGVERDVSLFMMQHEPVAPGDLLMVHVGYGLQKVSEAEAAAAWELYDQILETVEAAEAAGAPGPVHRSA